MTLTREEEGRRHMNHWFALSTSFVWGAIFVAGFWISWMVVGYVPFPLAVEALFMIGIGIIAIIVETISPAGPYGGIA